MQPFHVVTEDGKNFTLLEPVYFTRPSGEIINIPAGSQSDGASVPRPMWVTLPPFGTYWRAAFIHDYLYRCTERSKKDCDAVFKEAMEELGVSELDRVALYEGVHLLGWHAFNEDREKEK